MSMPQDEQPTHDSSSGVNSYKKLLEGSRALSATTSESTTSGKQSRFSTLSSSSSGSTAPRKSYLSQHGLGSQSGAGSAVSRLGLFDYSSRSNHTTQIPTVSYEQGNEMTGELQTVITNVASGNLDPTEMNQNMNHLTRLTQRHQHVSVGQPSRNMNMTMKSTQVSSQSLLVVPQLPDEMGAAAQAQVIKGVVTNFMNVASKEDTSTKSSMTKITSANCTHESYFAKFDVHVFRALKDFQTTKFMFLNLIDQSNVTEMSAFQGTAPQGVFVGPIFLWMGNMYVVFFCKLCGHFGLYNCNLKHRCSETEIQMLLNSILDNKKDIEKEALGNITDIAQVHQMLSIILCVLAAYSANVTLSTMMSTAAISEYISKAAAIFKCFTIKLEDSYMWIQGMFELMCVMIFMKSEPDMALRWHAFLLYLKQVQTCTIDVDQKQWYPNPLLPPCLQSVDILEMAELNGAQRFAINMRGLDINTSPTIYLAHTSWYWDDVLTREIPFVNALSCMDAIIMDFNSPEFRKNTTITCVVERITAFFLMLFLLNGWTKGCCVAVLTSYYEKLVMAVENDIGMYSFEYPTVTQLTTFIQGIWNMFQNDYISTNLIRWSDAKVFLTRIKTMIITMTMELTTIGIMNHYVVDDDFMASIRGDIDRALVGEDDAEDHYQSKAMRDEVVVLEERFKSFQKVIVDSENKYNLSMHTLIENRKEKQIMFENHSRSLHELEEKLRLEISQSEQEISVLLEKLRNLEIVVLTQTNLILTTIKGLAKEQGKLNQLLNARKELDIQLKVLQLDKETCIKQTSIVNEQLLVLNEAQAKKERVQEGNLDKMKTLVNVESKGYSYELFCNEMTVQQLQDEKARKQTEIDNLTKRQQHANEQNITLENTLKQNQQNLVAATKIVLVKKNEYVAAAVDLKHQQSEYSEHKERLTQLTKNISQTILEVHGNTQTLLQQMNDIQLELEAVKEVMLNRLQMIIANRKCESGVYLTPSSTDLSEMLSKPKLGKYFMHMYVQKIVDAVPQPLTMCLAWDKSTKVLTCKVVKGVSLQDPEYTQEELEQLAIGWLTQLGNNQEWDDFAMHVIGLSLCIVMYCLKIRYNKEFTYSGPQSVSHAWIHGISTEINKNENKGRGLVDLLKPLTSGFDHIHKHATLPHLHCDRLSTACDKHPLTTPGPIDPHASSRVMAELMMSANTPNATPVKVLIKVLDHEGKFFACYADSGEILRYDAIEMLWTTALLTGNHAFMLYRIFTDWLPAGDKRLQPKTQALVKLLTKECGTDFLMTMIQTTGDKEMSKKERTFFNCFNLTLAQLYFNQMMKPNGIQMEARAEGGFESPVHFALDATETKLVNLPSLMDDTTIISMQSVMDILHSLNPKLPLITFIMVCERLVFIALRFIKEQPFFVKDIIQNITHIIEQFSSLQVTCVNSTRTGVLIATQAAISCYQQVEHLKFPMSLFSNECERLVNHELSKFETSVYTALETQSTVGYSIGRDQNVRMLILHTDKNKKVTYECDLNSINLEIKVNDHCLTPSELEQEMIDCCLRLTMMKHMSTAEFWNEVRLLTYMYAFSIRGNFNKTSKLFESLLENFEEKNNFTKSEILKIKLNILMMAMKYGYEIGNNKVTQITAFHAFDLLLCVSQLDMPNQSTIKMVVVPGLLHYRCLVGSTLKLGKATQTPNLYVKSNEKPNHTIMFDFNHTQKTVKRFTCDRNETNQLITWETERYDVDAEKNLKVLFTDVSLEALYEYATVMLAYSVYYLCHTPKSMPQGYAEHHKIVRDKMLVVLGMLNAAHAGSDVARELTEALPVLTDFLTELSTDANKKQLLQEGAKLFFTNKLKEMFDIQARHSLTTRTTTIMTTTYTDEDGNETTEQTSESTMSTEEIIE